MSAPLEHVLKLSDEQWVRLERITGRFEEAWREGSHPSIEAYLPAAPEERPAALIELVHAELELRLWAGEPARVEEYFARFPALAADAPVAWDLITSELALRRAADPRLSLAEYFARFPGRESALCRLWESPPEAGPTPRPRSRDGPPAGEPAGARIGKFAIEEVAGRGAFGIVYRAWDTEAQRPVALKVLRTEHLIHPGAVDRLLREARSMAGLVHPWIVEVYETGWSGTTCYLASALIRGSTLADCMARGGFSFRQTAELVCRVADALQFAHERGVVHRDLKPSNILIDLERVPHITRSRRGGLPPA